MNQTNVLLAATLGCILTAPTGAAEPPKADPVIEEIKAILRLHDAAINKQDMKAVIGLYADNPDVVLMGTGPGEFWRGRAAVEETYQEFFRDLKAGSFQHECPDVSAGYDGNIAWLVASCNMRDVAQDGQAREYVMNVSGMLKKEKTGWRIQTLHFSGLTGDEGPPTEDDGAPAPENEKPAMAPTPTAVPKTQ